MKRIVENALGVCVVLLVAGCAQNTTSLTRGGNVFQLTELMCPPDFDDKGSPGHGPKDAIVILRLDRDGIWQAHNCRNHGTKQTDQSTGTIAEDKTVQVTKYYNPGEPDPCVWLIVAGQMRYICY
jgi:hypothetical protein